MVRRPQAWVPGALKLPALPPGAPPCPRPLAARDRAGPAFLGAELTASAAWNILICPWPC